MKKIPTLPTERVRALDREAEHEFGIPSLLLMENAGRGLAGYIRQFLIPPIDKCRLVMVCGTGNNGGDAFAAARHLFQTDLIPEILLTGEPENITGDAAVNYRIITALGISISPFSTFDKKKRDWNGLPVLIVDAMLGTGFKAPLRPAVSQAVRSINEFKKFHNAVVKVLAVDVPSGFDGDNGPTEETMKADFTVTFACYKPALVKPEFRSHVGRLEVVDIGIPAKLLKS